MTIQFFSIPKGVIGDEWIKCLKKHNPLFKQTNSSKVCELHFDSVHYEVSSTSICKTKRLNENAVPSIFKQSKFQIIDLSLFLRFLCTMYLTYNTLF